MNSLFMEAAFEAAQKSLEEGEVPVGAAFVYKNEVISSSGNLTNRSKNATTHCEINCIREISSKYG